MPITAMYTWAESDTSIQLQIPLKGQPKSKVDVFATECYLKVSFAPYLLELDLHGSIDPSQPRARTEKGILVIKLKKKGHVGLWGTIGAFVDRKSSPEARIRREESIKEHFKREEALKERIGLRKHKDERLALRSQMNVDEAERRRIEEIKAEQKAKAEEEVYQTFARLSAQQHRDEPAQPKPKMAPTPAPPSPPPLRITPTTERLREDGPLDTVPEVSIPTQAKSPNRCVAAATDIHYNAVEVAKESYCDNDMLVEGCGDVVTRSSIDTAEKDLANDGEKHNLKAAQKRKQHDAEEVDSAVSYVPEPRAPIAVVPIAFTTRLFPTPLRESKVGDESAWIMKNRRHLHRNATLKCRLPTGENGDDANLPVDISESDPVWLKGKGDDLYRGGDFLGAVNAYTAALDAEPANPAPYLSNRAACHLRLGNFNKCTADCGVALSILQSQSNSGPSQAKVLARRALAYREEGLYVSSLKDWQAALEFSSGEPELLAEIAQSEPLAASEKAKREAAARFAAGDIERACELYTKALAAVPELPSCLSNRAACHLALGRYNECERDCTLALVLLSADPTAGSHREVIAGATVDGSSCDGCHRTSDVQIAPDLKPESVPPGSVPPAGSEKRRSWVLSTVVRRARARINLGRVKAALCDYKAAVALVPGDKALAEDIAELTRQVQLAEMSSTH